MRDRQREPGLRVPLPQLLFMAAGVDPEDVRDPGLRQLEVELPVLCEEARVSVPDIERDRRMQPLQSSARGEELLVHVVGRAEVDRLGPGRVGWMEVATPGLDDREGAEMRKTEMHRAEPACGEADDRAAC